MNKHTPGPWKYDDIWSLIIGPKKEEVCAIHSATIGGNPTRINRDISGANANLIASAPDLLEACKAERKLLNDIYNRAINGEVIKTRDLAMQIIEITEFANQAISKAEGKEK